MARLYENPMAPPGYESDRECDIEYYMPIDPRMQQFMRDDNFESLLHLLDETLIMTEEETETEAIAEKKPETKILEIQPNTIALEKAETLDSLSAFIAEFKNKHKFPEKEVKGKRRSRKKSKHSKQSEKSSKSSKKKVHKNKSSHSSSTLKDPLTSRSSSQSTSSSTETSSKLQSSTTLDKSSIHITTPNPRSVSPQPSTSCFKSRPSKRSISPRHRLSSRQQYSSSRRSSFHSPSRSPSPTRSSSPQGRTSPSFRSVSPQQSASRYKSRPSKRSISPRHRLSSRQQRSRSPSPTRSSKLHTSPSGRSHPHHYSSSRRSPIRIPSRSPSPSRPSKFRSSPSRRPHSRRSPIRTLSRSPSPSRPSKFRSSPSRRPYSRRSPIRLSSRSPSFERLPSHYKPSKRSSKLCSSRSNKSPSYQRSPSPRGSHAHSPERSSSRYKSYDKSPLLQRSSSPCRSPSRSSPPVPSDKSSNHPKSSVDEESKSSKSPSNKSPIRQRKFPIEDDYTRILAEEMKKRQIWDGSDLEEEGEVSEQNAVIDVETPVKKEPVDQTKGLSQNKQNLEDKEVKIVGDDESQSNSKFKPKFLKQEIKSEYPDQKGCPSFYCQYCQLGLNSEVTWQSHITGKKHAKVLKLQTVHEVAKQSITAPSAPTFVSEDAPRFSRPPAGRVRRPIVDIPRIQPALDNTRNCLLGLQSVFEIRSEREVTYYCELCDAPCSAHSIMPHLIGYKHQLRVLREIDPAYYERNKLRPKKEFEYQLSKILLQHERKFGRGRMQVFEEWDDTEESSIFDSYSQPGPSSRNNPPIKTERNTEENSVIPANDECLDTSKSDFYCKLCDAHMNNMSMWTSHVIGKRHLRNSKKIPGESISKLRSVKAPPNTPSKLDQLIRENAADEIIVGLDSIRETQGPNGENYTCFPCGSNCTNFDIIDHLLLTKHRIRYLEKLVVDGKPNGITTISQMEIHDEYFRRRLIDDECLKMMEKYGSGTAEVYLTKK